MAVSRINESAESAEIFNDSDNESSSNPDDNSDGKGSEDDVYQSDCTRTWRTDSFTRRLFKFTSRSAVNLDTTNLGTESPLDFFEVFFDQNLLEQIVNETNKYQLSSIGSGFSSHQEAWSNTNVPIMYSFFAIIMLMAHTNKNRLKDYWSLDPLIITPIQRSIT